MAQIDASIPLQSRLPQIESPSQAMMKAFTLKEAFDENRQREEARQQQMALREAFSTADMESPEGRQDLIRKAGAINPNIAMQLSQHFSQQETQKIQREHALAAMTEAQLKMSIEKVDFMGKLAAPVVQRYDDLIKKGATPEEASAAVSGAHKQSLMVFGSAQGMSPDQIQQLSNRPFNIDQARNALQQSETGRKMAIDELNRRKEEVAEQRAAEQQRHNLASEERMARLTASTIAERQGSGATGSPGGKNSETFVDGSGNAYNIDKKSGRAWKQDEDGKWIPINIKDVPNTIHKPGAGGTAGSRESVFNQRVLQAANQASKDLLNVVQLPTTSSTGIFGGRKQGPGIFDATSEVLANKMTSQDVQSYNAMSTGFQRTLAAIESAGLMPSGTLTHQMDAVIFKEGDTNLTKLHKLAQTRQIVDSGLEVMEANPRLSDSEKELASNIRKQLEKAVPFTHSDLIRLQQEQERNPKATLNSIMPKSTGARAKPSESDLSYLKAHPEVRDKFVARFGEDAVPK